MGKIAPARRVACKLLGEARRRDAHARELLRSSRDMQQLSSRDRSLATRLVLGVVGASGHIDKILRKHVSRPSGVEPQVRDALRLAAFELLFLDTPTSAAVSEGVELVRKARPRAAGMANAVLRKVAEQDVPQRAAAAARLREAEALLAEGPFNIELTVGDLVSVSGYPAWLLERVYAQHGKKAALDFALSALEPAPVYVAGNLALQSDRETLALLESKGLSPEPCELEGSFVLGAPAGLAPSGFVDTTQLIVADLSAQRIAAAAGAKPGSRVLEVGQGRGTKTLLLESAALRAGGAAHVVGVDSEAFKVRIATERMKRAGLSTWVSCVAADGCTLDSPNLPADLVGSFDLVFLDAPCSGTGTLRRHPEIAWRLEPAAVDRAKADSLPSLQLRLLTAAAARVAAGGALCYATCSVLREENEAVVEEFLSAELGSNFELEGASFGSHPAPGAPDGHFCARLVRKA